MEMFLSDLKTKSSSFYKMKLLSGRSFKKYFVRVFLFVVPDSRNCSTIVINKLRPLKIIYQLGGVVAHLFLYSRLVYFSLLYRFSLALLKSKINFSFWFCRLASIAYCKIFFFAQKFLLLCRGTNTVEAGYSHIDMAFI